MEDLNSPLVQIQENVFSSSTSIFGRLALILPSILGAIGILLVGWGVSNLVYNFIIQSSDKLHLEYISEKLNIDHFLKKAGIKSQPAHIIAKFLQGYIFTLFFISATNIVGLVQISEFLDTIIEYIPRVVVALVIILFGIQISNTVGNIVKGALHFTHKHTSEIIAIVARFSLIFFSILAALVQLNVATRLVEILFVGFISMIALGGGLALGLGGKETVAELLYQLRHETPKKRKRVKK